MNYLASAMQNPEIRVFFNQAYNKVLEKGIATGNFIYGNRLVSVAIWVGGFVLGRKVAAYIQRCTPLFAIQNLEQHLPKTLCNLMHVGYKAYSILFPENSFGRRLVTVILIENGIFALQVSIGHLFYTKAASPGVSVERKLLAAGIETIFIASVLDAIKIFASWFFIQPVKGYIAPIDSLSTPN